jgi:RNA polymerase sigma-70 factor (ECF subfamily)
LSVVEAVPARTRADQDLQDLYERHADRILGFCRRRLRSYQEAEDATQTTFLQAFRALQRGVVPVSETAWLFKIAENVCLSTHRTNGRRSERELADGGELIELAPVRDANHDALFGLEEALAAIPETQRRAFVLRELRGLSYKEIASSTGVSVTAVEMLIFRARRSLARALESGTLKGRIASVLDLGAAVNFLKTALGGATVAKVVSAAVAVAIVTVPAGDSMEPGAGSSPTTVRAESVERSRPSSGDALRLTPRASSRGEVAPRRAAPAPRATSDPATRTGLPRPGRLGTEPEPATPGTPPAAPAAPAAPTRPPAQTEPQVPSIPSTEPPAIDPVELPTAPQVTLPTVPELSELPLELPETPEIELPELPATLP